MPRRKSVVWSCGISLLLGISAQFCFALDLSVAVALGLYILAAFLFVLPFSAAESADANVSDKRGQSPAKKYPLISKRTEWLLLFGVLAVASFFRLYRLDSQPISLWIDESLTGLNALAIIEGKAAPFWQMTPLDRWRPEWVKTSNLYLYYVVLIFKLFGTGYFGLKMVSVLPAIAGVLAAYFLFKEISNISTAFIAAFLMAVSQWHVTISRWGWDAVLMSSLQLMSACLLCRAINTGKRSAFLLSGAIMGLCLYTYVAAWLALLIALTYLALRIVCQKGSRSARSQDAGVFLLSCSLVFAPLGIYYLNYPSDLVVRASEVNIAHAIATEQNVRPLWNSLAKYALMFNYRGDANARHGFPHAPLLDFWTSVLFVLGLSYCLRFWNHSQNLFALLWIALGVQAGLLADPAAAPNGYRTMLIIPPVCFFAAIGADRLWRLSLATAPSFPRKNRFDLVAALMLIAYIAFENYSTYFLRRPNSQAVWNEEGRDGRLPAALEALTKDSPTIVVDPLLLWKVVIVNSWFLTYRSGRLFEPLYIESNLLFAEAKFERLGDNGEIAYVFPPVFHNLLRSQFPKAKGQTIVTPAGEVLYEIIWLSIREYKLKMQSLDRRWLASVVAKTALLYENRAITAVPEMGPTEAILRDASRAGFALARRLDANFSLDSSR